MPFTHLHVHSNFSLLDGAATVQELTGSAAAAGMKALALTDHNGLYGAVRFAQAARQMGLRPIIGVEFTVEPSVGQALAQEPHLVLLAEDNEGYSNLCRLVTAARLGQAESAGPFAPEYAAVERDHPRLSQAHLRQHASHLIALSGCERGEINQLLGAGREAAAAQAANFYRGVFGPGNFFIELQHLLLPPPRHRRITAWRNGAGALGSLRSVARSASTFPPIALAKRFASCVTTATTCSSTSPVSITSNTAARSTVTGWSICSPRPPTTGG